MIFSKRLQTCCFFLRRIFKKMLIDIRCRNAKYENRWEILIYFIKRETIHDKMQRSVFRALEVIAAASHVRKYVLITHKSDRIDTVMWYTCCIHYRSLTLTQWFRIVYVGIRMRLDGLHLKKNGCTKRWSNCIAI